MLPKEVTVWIYGASGMAGRKPGKRKFSCAFKIGHIEFKTSDIVSEDRATWNEQNAIKVKSMKNPLKIALLDDKKKFGKIVVPIEEISSTEPLQFTKSPIKPAKKYPSAQGLVQYKCWVSSFRTENTSIGSSLSVLGSRLSLTSGFSGIKRAKTTTHKKAAPSVTESVDQTIFQPRVTIIQPREAQCGDTIEVRGRYFGVIDDDVVSVVINDINCDNFTLNSSSLFHLTIPDNMTPGRAEIIVTTKNGGRGICPATFTIVEKSGSARPTTQRKRRGVSESSVPNDEMPRSSMLNATQTASVPPKKNPFLEELGLPSDDKVEEKKLDAMDDASSQKFEIAKHTHGVSPTKERPDIKDTSKPIAHIEETTQDTPMTSHKEETAQDTPITWHREETAQDTPMTWHKEETAQDTPMTWDREESAQGSVMTWDREENVEETKVEEETPVVISMNPFLDESITPTVVIAQDDVVLSDSGERREVVTVEDEEVDYSEIENFEMANEFEYSPKVSSQSACRFSQTTIRDTERRSLGEERSDGVGRTQEEVSLKIRGLAEYLERNPCVREVRQKEASDAKSVASTNSANPEETIEPPNSPNEVSSERVVHKLPDVAVYMQNEEPEKIDPDVLTNINKSDEEGETPPDQLTQLVDAFTMTDVIKSMKDMEIQTVNGPRDEEAPPKTMVDKFMMTDGTKPLKEREVQTVNETPPKMVDKLMMTDVNKSTRDKEIQTVNETPPKMVDKFMMTDVNKSMKDKEIQTESDIRDEETPRKTVVDTFTMTDVNKSMRDKESQTENGPRDEETRKTPKYSGTTVDVSTITDLDKPTMDEASQTEDGEDELRAVICEYGEYKGKADEMLRENSEEMKRMREEIVRLNQGFEDTREMYGNLLMKVMMGAPHLLEN